MFCLAVFCQAKFYPKKIELPYRQGMWPAFWMLGSNIDSVGWPGCREIDIMEMIGGKGMENTLHGILHWNDSVSRHTFKGGEFSLEDGDFSQDFHLCAINREPEKISWLIDGKVYHEQNIDEQVLDAFHYGFYIILNLAVGVRWPGYPDESTQFPQQLQVDYIRVYQKQK